MAKHEPRPYSRKRQDFENTRRKLQPLATDRAIMAGIDAIKRGEDVQTAVDASTRASQAEWEQAAASWEASWDAAHGEPALPPSDTASAASASASASASAPQAAAAATSPRSTPDYARLLVPSRLRVAGWSVKVQRAFIVALAETGCVSHAVRAVDRSRQSAYALRARAPHSVFAMAWDIAIDLGRKRLFDTALEQALEGREVAVWYRGEQVGTRRVYNDRLTSFLLAHKRSPVHPALSDHEAAAALPQLLRRIDMVLPDPFTVRMAAQQAVEEAIEKEGAADAAPRPRHGDLFADYEVRD